MRPPLTLKKALKSNLLEEFIAQEEARGIGGANKADFEAALRAVAKPPQSEDQTSRSPSGDGSTGKRTRRGSG